MMPARSLQGKRLVLTGAGGFLGRNLLPLLLEEGAIVSAITSRTHLELCQIAGVDAGDECVSVVSQADRAGISEALADSDFLINAGFPRNTDGRQLAQGMEFIDWLFQEASRRGTRAVVNISSQSVYDQHRTEPAIEGTPVCPQSPYAVAKYATELMLDNSCKAIPHTNIRLASLIGRGFDQRIVNRMISAALSGEDLVALENGSRYGYLDVRDAAEALAMLCKTSNLDDWSDIYNVGPRKTVSIVEIAETTVRLTTNMRPTQKRVKLTVRKSDAQATSSPLDSSSFNKLTGWKQVYSLEDTISSILLDNLLTR